MMDERVCDTVFVERAPWGPLRYRKDGVPPKHCIYAKEMPSVKTPEGWSAEETLAAKKHFMLAQAKERMNHGR